jgi:P-type E1-E2 ATPase
VCSSDLGTLTDGELEVLSSQTSSSFTESDIFHMIYKIESYSNNKIGNTLVNHFSNKNTYNNDMINWNIVNDTVVVKSNGISSEFIDISNSSTKLQVCIGDEDFIGNEVLVNISESMKQYITDNRIVGNTVVLLKINESLQSVVVLGDRIRKDAKETIKYLQDNGINVWIASGDHQQSVDYIGSQLGIGDKAKGNLKPQEKVNFIRNLQSNGSSVVFIGDGFNDSPAMSQSDLGIALSSSVELSLVSSSIILQSNSLMLIPKVYELLVLTSKTISNNLFLSSIYNIIALPIASGALYRYGVVLNPSLCSLFMALSSVSVMGSSLDMSRRFENICKKKNI